MKDEPELIDIFAMLAMMGQASDSPRFSIPAQQQIIAERAYSMAQQMMETRKKFIGEQDD